jgi:hypothetical protein
MRRLCVVPLVALLLFVVGCGAHRVDASGNKSAIPVTPWENVLVTNAELAIFNNALAKGVIAANNVGVLDTATTEAITTEQFHIAAAKTELDKILDQGQTAASSQSDKIKNLTDTITASVNRLITSGNAGIKNKQNAAELVAEIQGLNNTAGGLVGLLKQVGVLK